MRQDPFPSPDDGEEPDSSVPPEDRDGNGNEDEGGDGPGQQGLFLSLPAGQFDPDQFACSGPAQDMPPGALLATILDAIGGEGGSGFPGLSEDQLVGMISAGRRMESWTAWLSMAAVGEFTRRHAGQGGRHEFAADELADELQPDLAVSRRADGLRLHRGGPAAALLRRAGRRAAAPGRPADHRG